MRLVLAMLLAACSPVAAQLPSFLPQISDAIPIQRLRLGDGELPPNRVAMPTAEFEKKLTSAGREPSQILSADYSATLKGTDLVGAGSWSLRLGLPLPLEPMTVAIREVKWPDGEVAVFDRNPVPRLLTTGTGNRTLSFGWSARGREEPHGVTFELRLPPAPIAVLTLDLPAGHTPVAPDALIDRIQPQKWRIVFSGKAKLDLTIRSAPKREPVLRCSRVAKYDFAPGQVLATFEFEIDSVTGAASTWLFRADPGVLVLNASVPRGGTWRQHKTSDEYRVDFDEPVQAGRVVVQTAIPLPATAWPCRGIHALGIPAGDAIELRLPSEMKLENWEPGDYLLSRSTALPDRGYAMIFRGSWRTAEMRKPPIVTVCPAGQQLATNAKLTWHPAENTNRVEVQLKISVLNGMLTNYSLRLPDGYEAVGVRFQPDDASVNVNREGRLLHFERTRPWLPGQAVELRCLLRGPPLKFQEHGAVVTVPQIRPVTATSFDGTLTVEPDERVQILSAHGFAPGESGWTRALTLRDEESKVTFERLATTKPVVAVPVPPGSEWKFENLRAEATIGNCTTICLRGMTVKAARSSMSVTLPPASRLLSATVGGHWIDVTSDNGTVILPARDGMAFEVVVESARHNSNIVSRTPDLTLLVEGNTVVPEMITSGNGWMNLGGWVAHRVVANIAIVLFALAGTFLIGKLLRKSLRIGLASVGLAMVGHADSSKPTVYFQGDTAYLPATLASTLNEACPDDGITGAQIEGTETDDSVRFTIRLTLWLAGDESRTIALPLAGLALEEATLDGKPAFPVSEGRRPNIRVQGRGSHSVVLEGRRPVTSRGNDREVTLTLDPLPSATLAFTAAPGSRGLTVPTRLGAKSADGANIHADLGLSGPLTIRWRREARADARVEARILTLWDAQPEESSAIAAVRLKVSEGTLTRLRLTVPSGLEPVRIVIRDSAGAMLPLRDWQLSSRSNGPQTLTLLLAEPLDGSATVIVKLLPHRPLTATPQLEPVEFVGPVAETTLGLRSSVPLTRVDLVACKPAPLERDWLSVPELNLERQPAPLFQPTDSKPSLKPVLPAATFTRPLSDELSWQFGKTATVEGTVRFPRDANLAAVEFDIPASLSNLDVFATEMAGWSRQDARVCVWFRTVPRDPVVKWTGQWTGFEPGPFELPMLPRATPWRVVRLKTTEEYDLRIPPTRGWLPAITLKPRESAWIAPAAPTPLKLSVTRKSVQ